VREQSVSFAVAGTARSSSSRSLSQTGEEFRICTADRNQATAARTDGLTVEFIA
jgi:hypothetical protein